LLKKRKNKKKVPPPHEPGTIIFIFSQVSAKKA
jgi:hypothetical protein